MASGKTLSLQPFEALHLTDANTGIAIQRGDIDQFERWVGRVFRTTDGGLTWTRIEIDSLPGLRDLCFVDARNGWVVGDSGTILRTWDNGVSWVRQNSGTIASLSGVSFADINTGIVVGTGGTGETRILRTTDGGETWSPKPAPNTADLVIYGVSLHGPRIATLVGYEGRCGGGRGCHGCCWYPACIVYRTTNGGETWDTTMDAGSHGQLNDVCFTDANTGIAVGTGGLILRTTTGGLTWVQDEPKLVETVPTETSLSQNYPNPFNPETKVRFSITSTQHATLTVYDLLGRRVAVLVDEKKSPGRYEVAFDGTRLASGMYICRLTAGTYVETRKMLLLK